jgi:uncharacterized protein (DUF1330 family)
VSAYVVASIEVTNPQGYRDYVGEVGTTMTAHGGEVLVIADGIEPPSG